MIGVAVAVAIGLYIVAVNLNRVGELRQRTVTYTAADQGFLELSSRDDFTAVAQKLGPPASDRSREVGTIRIPRHGLPRPEIHGYSDGRGRANGAVYRRHGR